MTFYSRSGILYVRLNKKRISTKLKDTPQNRKLVSSYYKNDEFFKKFDLIEKKISTVVELCEEVLIEKESTIKKSSLKAYRSLLDNIIVPYFDKKIVSEVKPMDIKEFYKIFTDNSTLTTCKAILKPAFELGLLKEEISINPIKEVSRPKIAASEYEANPFTLEEMKHILNSANGWVKNALGILFFTGLRSGELLALRWDNIDFKNMRITIDSTITAGSIDTAKTESSNGVIDLPEEALIFFKEQRKMTGLGKFVITSEKGTPYKYSATLTNNFYKVLNSLNLEVRGLHQTRHTFASLKLSYGERLEWVSYMLRHKSPTVTLNVYYKYIPRKEEKRVVFDMDMTQKRHS